PHRSLFGMSTRALSLAVTLFGFFTTSAFAQSVVSGTVTDPQAAVVQGAQVGLVSGQTEIRSTRTDAQGRYRFESVPPGTYVVSVTAPGFQVATSAGLIVTPTQGATRDVSLALAGATDFVSVEGRAVAAGYR